MKKILKISGGIIPLALPILALAQTDFDKVLQNAEGVVNRLVPIFITIAVIVFVWGIIQFISSAGDEEKRASGRHIMIWGLIGLGVIIGVWGFVNLFLGAFGVTPADTPKALPRIK